jgi:hypothetical protein
MLTLDCRTPLSWAIEFSSSMSAKMLSEVSDMRSCSLISRLFTARNARVSSSDSPMFLLSNTKDDVVVLEEAPAVLSKGSSSDERSRLLAMGIEL